MKDRLVLWGRGDERRAVDRGAVLIEFVLVFPLLALFAMGIVEYGIAWNVANDVNATARDAARGATSAPAAQTADRTVLVTVDALLTDTEKAGLEKVIVFNAESAHQTRPSQACLDVVPASGSPTNPGSAAGIDDECNVYGPNQVLWAGNNPTDSTRIAPSASRCNNSSYIDHKWCPITRNRSTSADNAEYVGVYIKLKHSSVTHFGFGDQTIERSAVFRLEPLFGES